jgi:hypothetical protein
VDRLTRQVTVQTADDLPLRRTLLSVSLDVGARAPIVALARHDRHVQGPVGGTVATAVQTMPRRAPAEGGDRGNAAEVGKGGLGVQALGAAKMYR